MSRVLLLITLLFAVASCDSIDGPPEYLDRVEIRDVDWLPGDTLLAALVSVPADAGGSMMFRIYDLSGNIRTELYLTSDQYATNLHITQDGQRALFSSNSSIYLLDIPSQTISIAFNNTRFISAAPDRDDFIFSRNQDNPNFITEVFARATFEGPSLMIDTFLRITNSGFGFSGEFPVFLSGGRLASMESDSAGSSVLKIRDSLFAVTKTFHLPTSLFFMNIEVPRADSSFYFVASGMRSELSRFRTDVGFIDPIDEIYSYDYYAVLSTGKKVIFRQKMDDNFLIKDIVTGAETAIPQTENATGLFLSPNDKLLAVVRGNDDGHKLEIITLP